MSDNLWPADFDVVLDKTPISILREQALALGARTANVVVGKVQMVMPPPGKFRLAFNLYCAPLGYQMTLFVVEHEVALYPAIISGDGMPDQFHANDPDEFTASLKKVFSQDRTKKIIASLIAQSKQ